MAERRKKENRQTVVNKTLLSKLKIQQLKRGRVGIGAPQKRTCDHSRLHLENKASPNKIQLYYKL